MYLKKKIFSGNMVVLGKDILYEKIDLWENKCINKHNFYKKILAY